MWYEQAGGEKKALAGRRRHLENSGELVSSRMASSAYFPVHDRHRIKAVNVIL